MCTYRNRGQFIVQIPEERQTILRNRYVEFLKVLKETNVPPVRIYDDLTKKQIEDLMLIREFSAELQEKKVEEVLKMNFTKLRDPEEALTKESGADEER